MSALLVLDTATPATVVGLRSAGGELIELRHDPAPGERPGHVAELPRLVLRACDEFGIALGELGLIGASTGPGSFTGLRIGLATARSLAQATGVPLAPVPTLAALAAPAQAQASTVVAVLDARRGEAFAAVYREGVIGAGPVAAGPGELEAIVAALDRPLAVGPGAIVFREVLEAASASVPENGSGLHRIGAAGLCELAERAQTIGYDELVPEYVREPDAKQRSTTLDIRRLAYADLPQIVAVERRTFTAPWSLSMFVLELSKAGGVCLTARLANRSASSGDPAEQPSPVPEQSEGITGYLICSRYDTVWHVMNVAVDPAHRRHGIASRLLRELLAIVGDGARLTLEVRMSNHGAIALYEAFGFLGAGVRRRYYADNGEDALIMWRTPATLAGRLDDIPAVGPVPRSELHG